MTEPQRRELLAVAGPKLQGAGVLDFVAAWYLKAAQYIQGTAVKVALVSTNSITQGEQVSILWGEMLGRYGIHIQFAHRTFKWSNEARGNANVFCIIVGFGLEAPPVRRLFDYATPKSEPQELRVKNINPYLVDAENVVVGSRSKPIAPIAPMRFGNMPLDGGHLILDEEAKQELLAAEPLALRFIRPLIGAHEFINNKQRWCLWLVDATPSDVKNMPMVQERIKLVKQFREASTAPSTQKFALVPSLFRDTKQPSTQYLIIPLHSSESRRYIPIGFMPPDCIANNSCSIVPEATLYQFGVMTSAMHMAWVRQICGRLKSDFRYSKDLVYNNFPFPTAPSPKQVAAVEAKAQQVLTVRQQFPTESLATLYDPLTMPPALVRAHQELDRAVDLCYRPAAFPTELSRLEFLFEQYRQLAAAAEAPAPPKPRRAAKA
ncbi:hypothetical protein GCM10027048_23860 [Hymenobacter coalescens]